jgi:ABC-type transport system substrate-binding protein
MQQFLNKVGITTDLQLMTANQRTEYSMNGWNSGFISMGISASLNYLSGIQYLIRPGGNLYVSMTRPDGFGELLSQATAAMDMATVAQLSQKINMLLYDNAALIPLWVAPQQIYAQQKYVQDAGLYSTGAQFDWTPEKAWLSK